MFPLLCYIEQNRFYSCVFTQKSKYHILHRYRRMMMTFNMTSSLLESRETLTKKRLETLVTLNTWQKHKDQIRILNNVSFKQKLI